MDHLATGERGLWCCWFAIPVGLIVLVLLLLLCKQLFA
jgi:hypothetical protein